jgi:hypothetical protein
VTGSYDRSFLPPAMLEATLLADTHHLVDPMMYATPGDSQAPELMEDWGARSDWAFELARDLGNPYVFHVGDLQQEYPDSARFEEGRMAVKSAIESSGLRILISVGNMDIGDKPDPTMPASWVDPRTLKLWEEDYGRSFHSVRHEGLHFVFLNSQIIESELPDADEQKEWFERELSENTDARTFVFLHMPPFVVEESEPGLGSYDAMGDRARSWFVELCRRYGIEAVFAGHTHFQVFNRVGPTRIYCLPSTTTTRPGWYEAFAVAPDVQGKADIEKLGISVLRIHANGHSVHLIRTRGETSQSVPDGWGRLLTGTTRDLSESGLGVFLRQPLVAASDGAVGYPYNVRHRVRDDYPFLACVELGLQHVRFPVADLESPTQADRLAYLRDEGVALTAMVIWDGSTGLQAPEGLADRVDVVEIQSAGDLIPGPPARDLFASLRSDGATVSLSPIVMEDTGLVHRRPRTSFQVEELRHVADHLSEHGLAVDRLVCGVGLGQSPSAVVHEAGLAVSGHAIDIDFLLPVGEDPEEAVLRVIEASLASACLSGSRVVLDPLQDSDRTASVVAGLMDRLSNPRSAYHAVAAVNTVLFGGNDVRPRYRWQERPGGVIHAPPWCVTGDTREIWAGPVAELSSAAEAVLADPRPWSSTLVVDPVERATRSVTAEAASLRDALKQCSGGVALVVNRA